MTLRELESSWREQAAKLYQAESTLPDGVDAGPIRAAASSTRMCADELAAVLDAVPAPPTRTEEPRRLTEIEQRQIAEARLYRTSEYDRDVVMAAASRLAFLEAEREKQQRNGVK